MHILFAGGGTAGHVNPALAIAGYIKEHHPDAKISYIGTKKGIEARLVPDAGFDFYTIDVSGFQRKISIENIGRNISAAVKVITSSVASKRLLKELKPDVVVGTGGYVSGPVLREATKRGIKTAIHEQNAFPGVTTKMLANKVDRVMLAMQAAQKHLSLNKKPYITGNPVRTALIRVSKDEAKKALKMDSRPVILSFGGSLGARFVNEAVCDLIKWHNGTGKFYHIHGSGKAGYNSVLEKLSDITLSEEIKIREYIDDMQLCMAAADLVICRAGAITLSELQMCSKPSVLIPSPYVAENHQFHNAMSLKNIGAAELIEEKKLTGQKLIEVVSSLIENKPRLEEMAKKARESAISDSNERIYKVIMDLYTNC